MASLIKNLTKPRSEQEIYDVLDGVVATWFKQKYGSFTPPQRFSIVEIHKKHNLLICSPTGSGKTLSAFLTILSELISLGRMDKLEDRTYAIYVSPLKALNNDIKRNLDEPLKEIAAVFEKKNLTFPNIRVAIRTGDTTTYERAKMIKKPPHILITTPESLQIMLSTPKASKMLEEANWVIVDEVHALAENKRGTALALSLERLEHRAKAQITRIGLSATVSPMDEMAKFLVGNQRTCNVVNVSFAKKISLEVKSPVMDMVYSSHKEISSNLYTLLKQIIEEHKTTLIFTNTRSATESVAHKLRVLFKGKKKIAAHHSSLSKETRFDVESRLKEGKIDVVVSSTSLELGIDIGSIDVVVLLGSPKSVARALQRVGRSGHRLHDTSKGILVALDRDDLLEEVVLAYCAKHQKIDKIRVPRCPLDVLAQHLVGMSLEKKWGVDEAFEVVKRAYPYQTLSFDDFKSTLEFLSGYHAMLEKTNFFGRIWYDGESFGRRSASRLLYYTNSGTIPETTYVDVLETDGLIPSKKIGSVEEQFAEELTEGDVFVLAGKTYEYVGSMGAKIVVQRATHKEATIPAWYSEMLPLAYDLAKQVEEFRGGDVVSPCKEVSKDPNVIKTLVEYQREQLAITNTLAPVVEWWVNDRGVLEIVFQFVAGKKANEAMAKTMAYRLGKMFECNVAIKLNDYGFCLNVPQKVKMDEEVVMKLLNTRNFKSDLMNAVKQSELLRRRFRHIAARSFLILKKYRGKQISVDRQQMNANKLLAYLQQNMPDFPMLKEAYREVMEDAMHVDEALDYLKKVKPKLHIRGKCALPSPFSFSILSEASSDVVMIQSRREFIRAMHERMMEFLKKQGGGNGGSGG